MGLLSFILGFRFSFTQLRQLIMTCHSKPEAILLLSNFEKSKIEIFKENSVVLKIKYNSTYNQEQKGHML